MIDWEAEASSCRPAFQALLESYVDFAVADDSTIDDTASIALSASFSAASTAVSAASVVVSAALAAVFFPLRRMGLRERERDDDACLAPAIFILASAGRIPSWGRP